MGAVASQITSLTIVYSTVYSDTDQRKHQSSASLAFGWGIHREPANSLHKWPVTRIMFPFDDVIMILLVLLDMNVNYNCRTNILKFITAKTWKYIYVSFDPPIIQKVYKCIVLWQKFRIRQSKMHRNLLQNTIYVEWVFTSNRFLINKDNWFCLLCISVMDNYFRYITIWKREKYCDGKCIKYPEAIGNNCVIFIACLPENAHLLRSRIVNE